MPSARPPSFGISADITWPICRGSLAPVSATAASTSSSSSSSESCVGQIGLDQLALEALLGRLLRAPRPLVGLRGLQPLLALPLQHRDLIALAQLGVLLERVDHHPQRRGALALRAFIAVRTSAWTNSRIVSLIV